MRATWLWGALATTLVACVPPPRQYRGRIHFDHEGLARRMHILCRLGMGGRQVENACPPPRPIPYAEQPEERERRANKGERAR